MERDFAAVESHLCAPEAPSKNRQTLMASIQAIGANQFDSLSQYFTEDTQLHIHGFSTLDGDWTGRDQVLEAMACNFEKLTNQQPVILSMVEQGNVIAVRVNETGVLKKGQCAYEVQAVLWYSFVDGLIQNVEEFVHAAPIV